MVEKGLEGISSEFAQDVAVRVQALARFSESHGISLDPGLALQADLLSAYIAAKERITIQTGISTSSIPSESPNSLTASREILVTEEYDRNSRSSSVSQRKEQKLAMARMRAEAMEREKERVGLDEAQVVFASPRGKKARNRYSEVKLEAPLFSPTVNKSLPLTTEEDTELLAQLIATKHKVQALQQRLQHHDYLRSQEASLQAELTVKIQSLTSMVSELTVPREERSVIERKGCGWCCGV